MTSAKRRGAASTAAVGARSVVRREQAGGCALEEAPARRILEPCTTLRITGIRPLVRNRRLEAAGGVPTRML